MLLDFSSIATDLGATHMTVITNEGPPSLDASSAAFLVTGDVLFSVRATIDVVVGETRSAVLFVTTQRRAANNVTVIIP